MIEILRISRSLSAIQRYSHTKLLSPESVLEHSGFVALISYYICQRLNNVGENLDTGLAVIKAIVHDIDESVTGDIPRITKYYNNEIHNALDDLSVLAVSGMVHCLDLSSLFDHWDQAKLGREGAVVALADIVAVVNKVYEEVVSYGNTSMFGHVGSTRDIVNDRIQCLFNQMDTNHGREEVGKIESELGSIMDEARG